MQAKAQSQVHLLRVPLLYLHSIHKLQIQEIEDKHLQHLLKNNQVDIRW